MAVEKMLAHWKKTFDSVKDGISIHDSRFNILFANKSFLEMLNKTREGVEGKKCYQIFHGETAYLAVKCAPMMIDVSGSAVGRGGVVERIWGRGR